VIPNGIDLEKFAPHKRNGDKAVQILFASRLDRDCSQGAHLLLDITPRLIARGYRVHITIAGGGQEHSALSKRAEDINRALNLDVVTVSGHVEDMPSLLSRQDVFIGVSRAAMEAAACGCAVILCGNEGYLGIWNRWNHSQATRTNLCCRSAPLPTVEALEKDLCKLLEDPALRASAASEAHTLVRKQFDGNAMLAAHLDLYRAAKKGRRVLCIGGYFGCGNLGDDLILDGFLRGVKKQLPSLRIIALSKSAGEDSRHFGIRCVGRRSPLEILPTLSRADAFLCGGGSLLQNKTGNLSLLYYLSLLRLAKAMHATPILYAAGIGPLLGKRACQRAKHTLESSPYLSLRDPDSLSTLQSLGIPQERLHLGADATFLLPVPQKRERQGASYVCIVLKGNGTLPSPLVPCAKELSRRRAISPVLVLFDRVSDKEATKRAALYLGVPILSPTDATETLSILAGASLVLTERLHAMILSLSVGTPAIGIVHDPRDKKIPSFAQLSGQSCFVGKEITQEALIDAALQLLEHEEKLRPILSERASALRKKAEKDLEKILSLLYNDTM